MIISCVFVILISIKVHVLFTIVRCVDSLTSLTLPIQQGGDMFVFTLSLLYLAKPSQLYNGVVLQ